MDNKKIGKLIASLRKKQNLTQQELGDKVGVGFRAVSKWERGINLPDIGIINDLSKTLGISSDELLSGEIKEEKTPNMKNKKLINIKIIITISLLSIILIFVGLFMYNKNKTYIYEIKNIENVDYYINGEIAFKGKEISIIINELSFFNKQFSSIQIKDYEYKILSNDVFIFGYGQDPNGEYVDQEKTIREIAQSFRVNYVGTTELKKKEFIENNLLIVINFIDMNNQEITKEIEISLSPSNKKN